jgi:hypothetical protein
MSVNDKMKVQIAGQPMNTSTTRSIGPTIAALVIRRRAAVSTVELPRPWCSRPRQAVAADGGTLLLVAVLDIAGADDLGDR